MRSVLQKQHHSASFAHYTIECRAPMKTHLPLCLVKHNLPTLQHGAKQTYRVQAYACTMCVYVHVLMSSNLLHTSNGPL